MKSILKREQLARKYVESRKGHLNQYASAEILTAAFVAGFESASKELEQMENVVLKTPREVYRCFQVLKSWGFIK